VDHTPASHLLQCICACLYFTQVLRPGTWSYTVSYDGGAPVTGVKIAGQSGELDPRKLNMDVSIASATASSNPRRNSNSKCCACRQKTAWFMSGH